MATEDTATEPTTHARASVLGDPLTLPCGLVLPNRIMKSAMLEGLADPYGSDVSPALLRLYRRWADSGAGTLITGSLNVQRGSAEATTVTIDEHCDLDALAEWAHVVHTGGILLIGQLIHQGRQTTITVARHPPAPSALPPVRNNRLFGSARALTAQEIDELIERFATAATLLEQAGFDGVEVHAAHGYLIGQFLSPATNLRTDEWGGDLARRSRFLLEVIRRIRARVDPGFAVLVKINSSDFQPGGFDADDSAHVVGMLGSEGVDLIEISGGTYESRSTSLGVRPDEPGTTKDAFFAGFAPRLRLSTDVPLALTGGLRSRAVMERLVSDGVIDVIGLGRPLVEQPEAPAALLAGTADRIELTGPPTTAPILELLWYIAQFRRLGNGQDYDPGLSIRTLQLELARGWALQSLITGRAAVGRLVDAAAERLRHS